jgi:hypothetical protein
MVPLHAWAGCGDLLHCAGLGGDLLVESPPTTSISPLMSDSKPDRGVAPVRTWSYNQDGALVAEFKRAVLAPRRERGS